MILWDFFILFLLNVHVRAHTVCLCDGPVFLIRTFGVGRGVGVLSNQTRAETRTRTELPSSTPAAGGRTTVAVFYKWGLCSAPSHRVGSGHNSELWISSCCNLDIMSPSANPCLLVLVFLCGLEEALLSHSGRCTDDGCVAVFVGSTDFSGAQKSCKTFNGQLFKYNMTTLTDIFKLLPSGKLWLEQQGAVAAPQTCSSIAVSTDSFAQTWEPCHENLSGYLCQYQLEDPCGELKVAGGSQVVYTAYMGFEVQDSQTFIAGTTAMVITASDKHLESKHVCFGGQWLKAPWNCDVMQGGCERGCNKKTNTCTCPAGQSLNSNGVTCEDVNRCEDSDLCTRAGEVCVNKEGGFECVCRDGLIKEDGVCVNNSICFECEHQLCVKPQGVYECACHEGYQVRAQDPTKCDRICTERQCLASCDRNAVSNVQCFCPLGFILDTSNGSNICTDINECEMGMQCQHTCNNLYGGFRCNCFDGFKLHAEYLCLPVDDGQEDGSSSTASYLIPGTPQPAMVPSYIKAGSALGITVFFLLCAALLFFLIYNAMKRCRRFDLTSLKHTNIDIFHLQQVTTDTYKRLSL